MDSLTLLSAFSPPRTRRAAPPFAPLMQRLNQPNVASHGAGHKLSRPGTPRFDRPIDLDTNLSPPHAPYMAHASLPQAVSPSDYGCPLSPPPPPTPHLSYASLPGKTTMYYEQDTTNSDSEKTPRLTSASTPLELRVMINNFEADTYYRRIIAMDEDTANLDSDNTPRLTNASLPRPGAASAHIREGHPSFLDFPNNNTEDATAFSQNERRNALFNILGSITIRTIQKVGLSVDVNQAMHQVTTLLSMPNIEHENMKESQKNICEAAVYNFIDVFIEASQLIFLLHRTSSNADDLCRTPFCIRRGSRRYSVSYTVSLTRISLSPSNLWTPSRPFGAVPRTFSRWRRCSWETRISRLLLTSAHG